jgi:hypothetical protein
MEIVMSRGEGDSLVIFTQEKELKPGLQQPGVDSTPSTLTKFQGELFPNVVSRI